MSISIELKRNYIPINIGEIELQFDTSLENISRLATLQEEIAERFNKYQLELIERSNNGEFDDLKEGVVNKRVIWAPRDGSSSLGSFGHVLIMTSDSTAIHCNYGMDGVTENDYNYIWDLNGRPREIVFRESGAPLPAPAQSEFDRELDVNTRLAKSDKPYYEGTLTTDYYVEAGPRIDSQDKEFLPAGTRVRVYEKLNGWSRINHPDSAQWVEDKYLDDCTDM